MSPRSTPNTSPQSSKSPLLPPSSVINSRSEPPTPSGTVCLVSNPYQHQQSQLQQMSRSYQSSVSSTITNIQYSNTSLQNLVQCETDSDNLFCVNGDVR